MSGPRSKSIDRRTVLTLGLAAAAVGPGLAKWSAARATAPASSDGLLAYIRDGQLFLTHPGPPFYRQHIPIPGRAWGSTWWSPDGSKLAVAIGLSLANTRLAIVTPQSGEVTQVPGTTGGLEPAWSRNGEWIAFQKVESQSSGISLVHPDGSGLVAISGGMVTCYDSAPCWSPGDQNILFVRSDEGGDWQLMVMLANGLQARYLYPGSAPGTGYLQPDWSPDGATIAYARYNAGGPLTPRDFTVWTADPNGNNPVQRAANAQMPRWLPASGSSTLVLRSETAGEIARLTVGASTATPIKGSAGGHDPAWGPGAAPRRHVAFAPMSARD